MTDELILPPKAWEKRLAEVQEFATANGMAVTSRCTICGAPIWDPKSLAARAGSTCRRRHANDLAGTEISAKSHTDEAA
ncbi:MAG: hypothetical protein ACTIID_12885 [Brevibacterium linens]|uniref:hypothetical protein n=1 Tax=Brevibacterium linens TaxID=1703 RepID=UPI003F9A0FCA